MTSCRLQPKGQIYFNARYYDPTTGRFPTEDPSRKGVNWYAYCENDPVNKTDPTGRLPVDYVADHKQIQTAAAQYQEAMVQSHYLPPSAQQPTQAPASGFLETQERLARLTHQEISDRTRMDAARSAAVGGQYYQALKASGSVPEYAGGSVANRSWEKRMDLARDFGNFRDDYVEYAKKVYTLGFDVWIAKRSGVEALHSGDAFAFTTDLITLYGDARGFLKHEFRKWKMTSGLCKAILLL